MNERDKALVSDLKERLPLQIKKHIKRFIVFGSRVMGEAIEESDLDIIALVDEKTPEIERTLDDIVYQVMWDHDFKPIISLKIFAESKFNDAFSRGFSFYRHVVEQGIAV
jgi:predicted nucleotidyltransferase